MDSEKTFTCNVDDYDQCYKIPKCLIKLAGLRLNAKEAKSAKFFWNYYYNFVFVALLVAISLEIVYAVDLLKLGNFEDTIELFEMLPCISYVILGLSKSYKIANYRPVFENLVNELRDMWPRGRVSEDEYRIINASLKQIKIVVKGYFVCNFILCLIFMGPDIWTMIRHHLGYDDPIALSYHLWLPFDPLQPYVYELVLLIETLCGSTAVLLLVAGDMLYCIFIQHISIQFNLLEIRIEKNIYVALDDHLIEAYPLGKISKNYLNSESFAVETLSSKEWEDIYYRQLSQIIQRHHVLLRLSDDVERMYGFSLLLNFFESSIIICACGFYCVIIEELTEPTYKMFLVTALMQIWLLCWYGQKLIDSSVGIQNALYNSGWYKVSKKISKIILIMMQRSQKAAYVSTWGFSIICFDTYTSIIKTAWSYFTLLLNMYEQ